MHTSFTLGRITAAALFAVAALVIGISTAFAAPANWDTTGSYTVDFEYLGSHYVHDMTLSQSGDSITGVGGGYPAGGAHTYEWAIDSGTVDGDAIHLNTTYTLGAVCTMTIDGTVAPGGTMSGTWSDNCDGARSGTWATASGTAAPILPPPPATTVVVSGNTAAGENQDGWMFNRDTSTQSPFSFQAGNASIGSSSLFVLPIANNINGNNDKFIGELFLLDPLSDINSISYDFKIASTGVVADKDHFYMNVYANFGESAPTKFYDCRYNIVPTTGVVDGYTTVTFDPTQSYPVTTRGDSPHTCPASPSGKDALEVGSPTIRVIALNVGDTNGSDAGVSGYYDKVVVNTDSSITTYDFEAAPVAPDVTVTIDKFIDGAMATSGSANGSAFPMTATWNAANIGAGSGSYDLDADGFNGDPTPYQAITSQMTSGADYTTSEVVGGAVVGATCADGKPFALNGYSYGDSLAAAQAAATSSQAPALTNITTNKYIIVHNKKCAAPPPPAPPANACATPTVAPSGYTLQNGTSGNNTVALAPNTMFVGKGGNDTVTGGDGNYIVCTAGGNDTITLGHGNSAIDAGGGNNTVTVGNGEGTIKSAGGNDTVVAGDGARTINVGGGNNKVTSGGGAQTISAGGGNDEIKAGAGDDTVNAGGGNNKVWGEAGADMLTTAAGNDTIDGGSETDTCQAGAGTNTKISCEL